MDNANLYAKATQVTGKGK